MRREERKRVVRVDTQGRTGVSTLLNPGEAAFLVKAVKITDHRR